MSPILFSSEFIVAACVVLIYQSSKFYQLSTLDPELRRRLSLLPTVTACDFAGRKYFIAALIAFLLASLAGFALLCTAPKGIIIGFYNISGIPVPEALKSAGQSPIYLAAFYMGLTQTGVPVISKIGTFQRDVFHYWIGVPNRVVEQTDRIVAELLARAPTRADRVALIKTLAGDGFIVSLTNFADTSFYKSQLRELKLDASLDDLDGSSGSLREVNDLIERLVFALAIATVRKNGGRCLPDLRERLGLAPEAMQRAADPVVPGIALFVFALALAWFLLPEFAGLARSLFISNDCVNAGCLGFWPPDHKLALRAIFTHMLPMFIAIAVAVHLQSLAELQDDAPPWSDIGAHFTRYASIVLVLMGGVVLYDGMKELYDWYSQQSTYTSSLSAFIVNRAPIFLLHALVPSAACFALFVYFSEADAGRRRRYFWRWAGILTLVVFALSALYAKAYLVILWEDQFEGLDYIVLVATLNVIAMWVGLLTALMYYDKAAEKEAVESAGARQAA